MDPCSERHVVVVAFPGVQPLDAVGPVEVFAGAGRAAAALGRAAAYRVTLASPGGARSSRAESGIVLCTAPLPDPGGADRHPGHGGRGRDADGRHDARARVVDQGGRTALPAGGHRVHGRLSRGRGRSLRRPARHHPLGQRRELAEEFPAVSGRPDPIYIRDGKYWTSAGVTAGIDLALALVQEDLGVDVAQTVARWLVMFLHRPGGQTQFASPVWVRRAERSTMRAVQALVESAPGGDHRVPTLAAAAAMSVRHFTRVFTTEVGETPGRSSSGSAWRRPAGSSRRPTTRST
jgi:transcriptional regulator GlxA family with amidase domain